MLCVVPDSNQLFGQLTAARPKLAWRELLRLSSSGQIRLAIPEVVQWELVNQLREDAEQKLSSHRSATQRLRGLGLHPPSFAAGEAAVEALLTEAGEALRQEILGGRGEILPVPAVEHSELARRSLHRRPPFDAHDRGYRDALIWHTVLDLVEQGEDVLLVSDDARAFSSKSEPGRLHPALASEVEALCGDRRRVHLARELHAALTFVTQHTNAARSAAIRALGSDELTAEVMMAMIACADGEVLEQAELHAQGWQNLIGVRVYPHQPASGLDVERATSVLGEPLSVRVSLVVEAELDVRFPLYAQREDDLAMVGAGELLDFGVGWLDDLVHLQVARAVEIRCTVQLLPADDDVRVPWRLGEVSLRELRVPRAGPGEAQLRLNLDGHPVA